MIFSIFSPKKIGEKLAFLTQHKAKSCTIFIITLVFEKSANFSAEIGQKSQKIVIITLTPRSQSYIHELQHQWCTNYNTTSNLVHFEKEQGDQMSL
jgi:hypothetical protein